jgi:hypothetical protein
MIQWYCLLLGTYLKESKSGYNRDTHTPMYITALFTIAKPWKQPWCPTTNKWIKKLWYIYTMEFYSALGIMTCCLNGRFSFKPIVSTNYCHLTDDYFIWLWAWFIYFYFIYFMSIVFIYPELFYLSFFLFLVYVFRLLEFLFLSFVSNLDMTHKVSNFLMILSGYHISY